MKQIRHYGLTEIAIDRKYNTTVMTITHNGNMGNSVKDVEKNVRKILGKSLDSFLKPHKVISDESKGSPDYSYTRKITFKRKD